MTKYWMAPTRSWRSTLTARVPWRIWYITTIRIYIYIWPSLLSLLFTLASQKVHSKTPLHKTSLQLKPTFIHNHNTSTQERKKERKKMQIVHIITLATLASAAALNPRYPGGAVVVRQPSHNLSIFSPRYILTFFTIRSDEDLILVVSLPTKWEPVVYWLLSYVVTMKISS